jgi:hypothetical protein
LNSLIMHVAYVMVVFALGALFVLVFLWPKE